MSVELRRELRKFAELMESRLRMHDADRGDSWKECDSDELVDRLDEELFEAGEPSAAASEWADVANFALFLWWRSREAVD